MLFLKNILQKINLTLLNIWITEEEINYKPKTLIQLINTVVFYIFNIFLMQTYFNVVKIIM